MRSAGGIMSFVFEFDAYCENGHATHANASVAAESRPPEAATDETKAEQAERVEEDRGEVHRGQRVPLVRPAEDQVARDVGLVGDRAVGVAERVRVLADAVRLDTVAHLARAVGGPALRPVALDRGSARTGSRRVMMRFAPITPEYPTSMTFDERDVQPDAEAGGEDGRRDEQPHRPHGSAARAAGRSARPRCSGTSSQTRRRVGRPHRSEHVAVVEEPQRDREREQHDEIEVAEREQAAPVDEPDQEERAEPEPDRVAVDLRRRRTRRCSRAPSARRPAAPSTPRRSTRLAVVDGARRDLAGRAREDVHRPRPCAIRRIRDGLRRVPLQPGVRPSGRRRKVASPARSVETRLPAPSGEPPATGPGPWSWSSWSAPVVVAASAEGTKASGSAQATQHEASPPEAPELVAEEVERRDEDDRDRLRDDLPPAEPVEEDEQPQLVDAEDDERDEEEADALVAEVALLARERPVAVPPVVVRPPRRRTRSAPRRARRARAARRRSRG